MSKIHYPTILLLGVRTGKCVKSDQNASISVCQIYAWCPVELDVLPMPGHGFKYVTQYPIHVLIRNTG